MANAADAGKSWSRDAQSESQVSQERSFRGPLSIKNQIETKLNQALKDKDKNTYPTLRLVLSAIKDAEIASRTKGQKEMSDSEVTSILKKDDQTEKRIV